MQVQDGNGAIMEAMYFGDLEIFESYLEEKFGASSVAAMWRGQRSGIKLAFTFYPTVNEYMGRKTVQIVIQNYQ